jgi:peptidoglycan/LPS O-acetylase OafA/YrhL
VIYHIAGACSANILPKWSLILSQGHLAVTIFIILSGFSLMLPLSTNGADSLPNVKEFFIRRSRRILPPYYAALVLTVILALVLPASIDSQYAKTDGQLLSGIYLQSLIAHALMLHNFNSHWIFLINTPMWSVPTEWDIYFLFPLLLLPLRSKFGAIVSIICGSLFGLLCFIPALEYACFWYAGSFAMGMLAADYCYKSPEKLPSAGVLYAIFFIAIIGSWLIERHMSNHIILHWMSGDLVASVGAACLILALFQSSKAAKSVIVSFLSSRPIDQLGLMSYSLYLIHFPLITLAANVLKSHGYDGIGLFVRLLGTVPVILIIVYVLHVIFERPFMRFKSIAKSS